MSADNGHYVLQLRDQSRVVEMSAIENLYWWFCRHPKEHSNQMNPCWVVDAFQSAPILSPTQGLSIAWDMEDKFRQEFGFNTEYGVTELVGFRDYSWDELVAIAKGLASLEINAIRSKVNNNGRWDSDIRKLEKLANVC